MSDFSNRAGFPRANTITRPLTASTSATSLSCIGAGAGRAAGSAPAAGAGPPPITLNAVWHLADSEAEFRCRQANAAGLPGLTFEQCATKSFEQAELRAFSCAVVGRSA